MPNLSIYITDEIYQHLMVQGKPSAVGKEWIEERYNKERGIKK
ncbi:MAG: hypothetical protein ABIH47_00340 [Candidatus Omnitrophota bacterium]